MSNSATFSSESSPNTATGTGQGSVNKAAKPVLAGIAAVIVLGAAVAFFSGQRKGRDSAFRDRLFAARAKIAEELKAQGSVGLEFKKLDVDAKIPEGVKLLKEVAKQAHGTRVGFEANVTLGDLYFDHGNPAQATDLYKTASEMAPSAFDKTLALAALAGAYENAGKNPEAVQAFDQALLQGEASLKGDLLLGKARALSASSDTQQARAVYDQILSQLPNSAEARTAEQLKALLK